MAGRAELVPQPKMILKAVAKLLGWRRCNPGHSLAIEHRQHQWSWTKARLKFHGMSASRSLALWPFASLLNVDVIQASGICL